MDRGFGRCMVIKKFSTSIKRYNNGAVDKTAGPVAADAFPGGETDQRFKKQQFLDPDGICQVIDAGIFSSYVSLTFLGWRSSRTKSCSRQQIFSSQSN